jgi:hypothetical protein
MDDTSLLWLAVQTFAAGGRPVQLRFPGDNPNERVPGAYEKPVRKRTIRNTEVRKRSIIRLAGARRNQQIHVPEPLTTTRGGIYGEELEAPKNYASFAPAFRLFRFADVDAEREFGSATFVIGSALQKDSVVESIRQGVFEFF